MHPIGVIVRRLADFRQPQPPVERGLRNPAGAIPHVRLGDHIANAVAGEGELARQMTVRILIDHAAHGSRIVAREHAVHHHLRDRDLAADRLAPRFEVDRFGKTLFLLGAFLLVEQAESLGRRFDLSLADHGFASLPGILSRRHGRLHIGIRGQTRGHDHRFFTGLPALQALARDAQRTSEIQACCLEGKSVGGRLRLDGRVVGFAISLEIAERLSFERTRNIILRQWRRLQRFRQFGIERRRLGSMRGRRALGSHHRCI